MFVKSEDDSPPKGDQRSRKRQVKPEAAEVTEGHLPDSGGGIRG